jgi:hypothetical protein
MKRLVGLFLAVCCLALVQVQPVAPLATAKAPKADCCGGDCQCDHDCERTACPIAPGSPASSSLPRTAQVVIEVSKPSEPRQETSRPRPSLPPIALFLVSQRADAARTVPTPQVPLFTRHCAFLI